MSYTGWNVIFSSLFSDKQHPSGQISCHTARLLWRVHFVCHHLSTPVRYVVVHMEAPASRLCVHLCVSLYKSPCVCHYVYVYLYVIDFSIRVPAHAQTCYSEQWLVDPRCCLRELCSAFRLFSLSDTVAHDLAIYTSTLTAVAAESFP